MVLMTAPSLGPSVAAAILAIILTLVATWPHLVTARLEWQRPAQATAMAFGLIAVLAATIAWMALRYE